MATSSVSLPRPIAGRARLRARALGVRQRPELAALLVLAGVLYLWSLSRNGFANEYYSAAVRSMSQSWHAFLYGSFDSSGVMTVDKPPLALWVQALSVRAFGYGSWSMLVPQALMGVGSVALVYDLTRRTFGRPAGFAAGLVLALTPVTVAISRHNNPDAMLVLCVTAALWFMVRALEDGRTRWVVLSGVAIGLGFEAKMLAALLVAPALAAAWLWVAPRGRLAALRQLGLGGLALAAVGLAWPLLVWVTPASDRPWISGTSDNSIWSLIFGYNGLGRLTGQQGAPGGGPGGGGGGGGAFGGDTGVLRLLNESLGGQAGWLLGFAVVAGIGVVVVTRLRRSDVRSGWIIAVGGAFLTIAVAFSQASGIFHPYYVSELAPFTAALVGAGIAVILRGDLTARVVGPAAIAAGIVTELIVLGKYPGQLTWVPALLIVIGGMAAVAIALGPALTRAARTGALIAAMGVLLLAPGAWAFETLGHATSGTFPAGGPASAGFGGGPGGGPGGGRFAGGGGPPGFGPQGSGAGQGGTLPPGMSQGGAQSGTLPPGMVGPSGSAQGGSTQGLPQGGPGAGGFGQGPAQSGSAQGGSTQGGLPQGGFGQGGGGGMFGGDSQSINQALSYVKAHGGGTLAVSSQSGAAGSLIQSGADVAAIGGFSGRESQVSISWLADAVERGQIRWVLTDGATGGFQDNRVGSSLVMAAVQKVGTEVGSVSGLYDLQGHADQLRALAN